MWNHYGAAFVKKCQKLDEKFQLSISDTPNTITLYMKLGHTIKDFARNINFREDLQKYLQKSIRVIVYGCILLLILYAFQAINSLSILTIIGFLSILSGVFRILMLPLCMLIMFGCYLWGKLICYKLEISQDKMFIGFYICGVRLDHCRLSWMDFSGVDYDSWQHTILHYNKNSKRYEHTLPLTNNTFYFSKQQRETLFDLLQFLQSHGKSMCHDLARAV
ncbi:hypothetical protein [Candidatus Uabimicrobium amorphum]|uniref:Uncharacterized protein n=1 Tax=Uabimicrobium amorphum TaxID=2596890 RepID=A0A5S9IQI3_UABAM|nr:hypothetical protein [Candidatus Uabimicrobium amorphum]BBM86219.1 hypothetical protein UABAM_04605 [Candidatus Uabimicrobium amorphum]